MSIDFNRIILVGRCGDEPKVFRKEGQAPFARVSLASNKKWKKDNRTQTHTDWHTIIFNNALADIAEKYLRKGEKILVEGESRPQRREDENGNVWYEARIQAKRLQLLSPKPKQEASAKQQTSAKSAVYTEEEDVLDMDDNDIAF
jgi:single-strand DNA-binding protein